MKTIAKPIPWSRARKESVTGIVLHGTAGASALSSIAWLNLPKVGNSYHYIIEDDGTVYKCVPASRVAFHAGVSKDWAGSNSNNRTVGIAFANIENGREPITEEQLTALYELVAELKKQFPELKYITRHKDVSPGRKTDPIMATAETMDKISRFCKLEHWRP